MSRDRNADQPVARHGAGQSRGPGRSPGQSREENPGQSRGQNRREDGSESRGESQIPLIAANGQALAGDSFSRVLTSSAPSAWPELVVEQHRCPATELNDLAYTQHVLVINVGGPLTCEYKHEGRWKSADKAPGAVSFFPHRRSFTRRMRVTANVVCVAMEPTFFASHLGEDMLVGLEFAEQRQAADPLLFHLARTLQEASRNALRHDSLFGSSVSLALARHLLLNYGSQPAPLRSRASATVDAVTLRRAQEFMHAHLHSGMTVAQIARAVHLSPLHLTRLFRHATGLSPYRYVMRLRMLRAKEMLMRGTGSLKELAYDLGFADQSHFTRQFKRTFGSPPKAFLRSESATRVG